MARLACVDLPAFPLQLLLREHPEWRDHPAAVVEHDRPQGTILWVNSAATRLGIRPGLRYAGGLSLAAELRAGTVSEQQIRQGVDQVAGQLRRFSPEVEPCAELPGVFWLDAGGLGRLHPDLRVWGDRLRARLRAEDLYALVVVGWTRFGTFAVARGLRHGSADRGIGSRAAGGKARPRRGRPAPPSGTVDLPDRGREAALARRVPLQRLAISPKSRDLLEKLDAHNVGDLLKLPAGGLRERFGPELHQLHCLARGDDPLPLQGRPPDPPLEARCDLEPPVANITELVFHFSRLLHPLLERLAERGNALAELRLALTLEESPSSRGDARRLRESLRPAVPTLDAPQLLHLMHLRLERIELAAVVETIALAAEAVAATEEQLLLFVEAPRRDLEAADRALARIRAELGNDAVVRAAPHDAHLPEASFRWEPVDRVSLPILADADAQGDAAPRTLIRRIERHALLLPPRPRIEPDGWLLAELEAGPVVKKSGPYLLSGAWWHNLIHREYHFAELRRGDIVWVYCDRRRKRWFLQGAVE